MIEIEKYIPKNSTLRKYIRYFWVFDNSKYVSVDQVLIPVTNCEMIYNLSDVITYHSNNSEMKMCGTHVLGGRNQSLTVRHSGVIRIIGVSFHDFTSLPFIKKALKEYKNSVIDLSTDKNEMRFNKKLRKSSTALQCIPLLEKHLYDTADFSLLPSSEELHLLTDFKNKECSETVQSFCTRMHIHTKKLERLCYKYSGLSPKQYAGTLRIQQLVTSLIQAESVRMTDKAYLAGYFDQTHMIKDFKTYLNEKPLRTISQNMILKCSVKERHV